MAVTYSRFLVDLNDEGKLYSLTIETPDAAATAEILKQYSSDVRWVEDKKQLGRQDKGNRALPDGSIIRRCVYFGDKIGVGDAFVKRPYKIATIDRAVIL